MAYDADLEYAHRHCASHRAAVLASDTCACFHCLAVFKPAEILDWVDEGEDGLWRTALCPRCGVDSVIGSASGVPLDEVFMRRMQ